jgi:hypothetical protein
MNNLRGKRYSVDDAIALVAEDPFRYAAQRKSTVPEGAAGVWKVSRFEMDLIGYISRRSDISGMGTRSPPPGKYTHLCYMENKKWHVMMSDTPAELIDHIDAVRDAAGDVLVTGLGLGIIVDALMLRFGVRSVTVLEKDMDVIGLVAPHIRDLHNGSKRGLRILHADAYTWIPDKTFDCAFHDIWPSFSPDNLKDMRKLKKRLPGQLWTRFWGEKQCKAMRNFEKKPSREAALKVARGF